MSKIFKNPILIFIALVCLLPIALYLDYRSKYQPETSKDNWGIIKDVRQSTTGGIFGGQSTQIITDKSSLTIYGSPTINIGDTLWIRHSNNKLFILSKLGNRIFIQ